MAPGPDSIQYAFWKCLAAKATRLKLPPFWDVFRDLTSDIRLKGMDWCHFKDANLSLFYMKGNPTLTKNYCPISSMNTDCKMYTNLINARLAPWAVSKLHQDQKGFVPGCYITKHTWLASEVVHLSNVTETDGLIVSLNQAKVYDHVDLPWLLSVLETMGLDANLIMLIKDLTHRCQT